MIAELFSSLKRSLCIIGTVTIRLTKREYEHGKSEKDDQHSFVLASGEKAAFAPHGHVNIEVVDTGPGLSTDQLEKLFGEGIQFDVNNVQAGKGSGLGLYISKGIINQHRGSLTASSEGLGHGATFVITLPLYHVPNESLPESLHRLRVIASISERETSLGSEEDGHLTILIVDDIATNRKLLRRLLENRGHACEDASDGHIALEMVETRLARGERYDTILLDYEMPVMPGPIAAKKMREAGCDAFIAGITGNVMPEDTAFFKANGANCVLPKPVSLEVLQGLWKEYGVVGTLD